MIEEAAAAAGTVITIGPGTLIGVSIGSIGLLISGVALAVHGYTTIKITLASMGASLKKLESWHLKATESQGEDLDKLAAAVERRQHRWRTWQTDVEVRLGSLEQRWGTPMRVAPDLTPVDPLPRRARTGSARESTPDPDGDT